MSSAIEIIDAPPVEPHICASASGGNRCDICFGPVAPTPFSLPPGWDGDRLLELAREVAMNIQDLAVVLQTAGISTQQYDRISQLPFYARALEAFRIEWESATNTNKRLAIKAATALEAALPKITGRLSDKDEGLDAVVKGAHLLAKISGLEEKKDAGAGEKFTININLGADEKLTFQKDITPQDGKAALPTSVRPLIEGTADEAALQPVPQENRNSGSVQQIAEGARTPTPVVAQPQGSRSSPTTEN